MNGTMEEHISPDFPANSIKVTSDNSETAVKHCENGNKIDNGDHLENESSKESVNNSTADNAVNEDSSDSVDHATKCGSEASIKSGAKENSNNENPLNSHCSNSNESYADSVTSSHAKSDSNELQGTQNIDEKNKDGDSETNYNRKENSNGEDSDDVDSEDDSSDDESVISGQVKPEDTVSVNSDSDPECEDDTSQESQTKDDHIIILDRENRPDSQNDDPEILSPGSEIHEIPSDNDEDCVLTNDDKSNSSDNKVNLRRSLRASKRKRHSAEIENGNNESDIEEVEPDDPLNHQTKPIIINDTKALVEMAAKQMKSNNNQKKDTTVVIIDTHSKASAAHVKNSVSTTILTVSAHSRYQSIVARSTTVTPVSSKNNASTQSAQSSIQTAQPSILPSLTDDMFVVEAPSFIVPYVYEKPSVKPFREFVDVLGKELETKRAKEEQEQAEKEKEEKDKNEKEKKERKERGEDVSESEEEPDKVNKSVETEEDEKKKKRAEKRERRKHRTEDEDASWDGESTTESDDETMSDDEVKTVVLKEKADSIEEIKTSTDLTTTKVTGTSTGKSDNYFDCSLGKFFINIGLNLVQEYVQNDLLKQQNRKLYREKKSGHSTKATESSIASLKKNLEFSKVNNAPFAQPQKKCEFCSFKTESMLAMNNHLETPHMKNNVYKCNFCAFEIRSPHDILYHMEAEHNIRGKLERAPAYHQCPNCPFEDNGKGKLARHQIACAKKYKPELNLSPPIEWEPPAKIPKLTRARNSMVNSYQNVFSRQVGASLARQGAGVASLMAGGSGAGAGPGAYRPRGRSPITAPRGAPVHGTPVVRAGVMIRHNAPPPILMPNNYPIGNNGKSKQPSISITPLPRQPQPVLPQQSQQNKGTFVICEICDGYIKDLEQLRNHMQWIHKVKIHPKMIYNRPPLNCQKCQFRFFTDQGLERHLLGSHGLVTSSMQEAANKGKDAGRCPVCGRVYQWKLLNHVARDHNLTLKPAHLSYKCTVCTATFGMYKQFENHVYSAHSVVAKRVMDKNKTSAPAAKSHESLLKMKALKINDEITIIPQPMKQASSAKNK